jgi:hypothetical protein
VLKSRNFPYFALQLTAVTKNDWHILFQVGQLQTAVAKIQKDISSLQNNLQGQLLYKFRRISHPSRIMYRDSYFTNSEVQLLPLE